MADTKPGKGRGDPEQFRRYWTRTAKGLKKWVKKKHPMTALHRHLSKHMPSEMAWRVAATWFRRVHGYWPAARGGKNPVGRG